MTQNITVDKNDQLDAVREGLLQGEQIFAVLDGKGAGTGFIGLTDRRAVLQDNSFAGKKSALTSIPYGRINSVSFVSDKSMFGKFSSTSTLAIDAGGRLYEVDFRGHERAKLAHDIILSHILS
jgi:hypothetical protein